MIYLYTNIKNICSVSAAELWNALPASLRTTVKYSYFKSNVLLLIRKN